MNDGIRDILKVRDMGGDRVMLDDILDGCLFYPAAGSDITPLAYRSVINSFVYCDWHRQSLAEHVNNIIAADKGDGLRLLEHQQFTLGDLGIEFVNASLPNGLEEHRYFEETGRFWADKANRDYATFMKFGGAADDAGAPERPGFSILYICDEATRLYRALFNNRGVLPAIACLIRPGNINVNWDGFEQDYLICMGEHPHGLPPQMSIWHPSGNPNGIGDMWRGICPGPAVSTIPKVGEEGVSEVSLFNVP